MSETERTITVLAGQIGRFLHHLQQAGVPPFLNDSGHPRPRTSPRACLHRLLPVTVVMGDDSDSDEILMSEDATNWRSVGKSVNPLAEIAKITKGRTPVSYTHLRAHET